MREPPLRRTLTRNISFEGLSQTVTTSETGTNANLQDSPTTRKKSSHSKRGARSASKRNVLCGLLVIFLIALGGLWAWIRPVRYALIIDAGSTGTRIHVYRYTHWAGMLPSVHFPIPTLRIEPGLSSYSARPSDAAASIRQLVDFAAEHVPARRRAQTPLFLLATAGLRLLPEESAEHLLQAVRPVLAGSPFLFRDEWASILPGQLEGVYAWIAANYAAGKLRSPSLDPLETIGVLEMGGASMQATFVPGGAVPAEFEYRLELAGRSYLLYAHSFLGLGLDAARALMYSGGGAARTPGKGGDKGGKRGRSGEDPCLPRGYEWSHTHRSAQQGGAGGVRAEGAAGAAAGVAAGIAGLGDSPSVATGDFAACRAAALAVLQPDAPCAFDRCGAAGAYTPRLRGSFLASENFHYTVSFLGLPDASSLADVEERGRGICATEWKRLEASHLSGPNHMDLAKFCFGSAYLVALLHDAFGVGMHEKRLLFSNEIDGVAIDWTLGAIVAGHGLPEGDKRSYGRVIARLESSRLFRLLRLSAPAWVLAVVGFVALAALLLARRRRGRRGPGPAGAAEAYASTSLLQRALQLLRVGGRQPRPQAKRVKSLSEIILGNGGSSKDLERGAALTPRFGGGGDGAGAGPFREGIGLTGTAPGPGQQQGGVDYAEWWGRDGGGVAQDGGGGGRRISLPAGEADGRQD